MPSIAIEHEGVMYESINELAKKFDIPYGVVLRRFKQGCRGDELVTPSRQYTDSSVIDEIIHGKRYTHIYDVAEEHGIALHTLLARYRVGDRGDRLVRSVNGRGRSGKPLTICNIEYSSIKAAAEALGLSDSSLRYHYSSGKKDEDLIGSCKVSE